MAAFLGFWRVVVARHTRSEEGGKTLVKESVEPGKKKKESEE